MASCKECKEKRTEAKYTQEILSAFAERTVRRLWVVIIVLIMALVACNGAWLYAWMQYDYTGYELSADGDSNANFIGGNGNNYNVSESQSQEKNP